MSVLTPRLNNVENNAWKIGDIKQSFLTEAQFQDEHDSTWILCDGRNIEGTDLATVTGWTTVPDARGQFLRGKNNGRSDGNQDPAGERTLGNFQNDAMQRITGGISASNAYRSTSETVAGAISAIIGNVSNSAGGDRGIRGFDFDSGNSPGAKVNDNETRVKNLTVNMYIKINRVP
jgi:hypothetical protein